VHIEGVFIREQNAHFNDLRTRSLAALARTVEARVVRARGRLGI
jgi:hypothetical protein